MRGAVVAFGLIFAGLGLAGAKLAAQDQEFNPYSILRPRQSADAPDFAVNFVNLASEFGDLSKLYVVLKFNNHELQFIKGEDKPFQADFEVKVTLLDQDSVVVEERKWGGSVVAETFDLTTSKRIFHTNAGFIEAPPGTYRFRIGLTDKETRRTGYREGSVTLRDFSGGKLQLSDVWFADTTAVEPLLANGHSRPAVDFQNILAFFEVYNAPDTITIAYEILEPSGKPAAWGRQRVPTSGPISRHYLALARDILSGRYQAMRLRVIANGDSVQHVQRLFPAQEDVAPRFTDLRDAIQKLEYLAKEDEIKRMLAAEEAEQKTLFEAFWKKRDPTPETEENEYLEEYYSRINRASRLFKNQGSPGWKTDMGRVYVMLGPPDDIKAYRSSRERFSPSFTGATTLVWEYYELRRRVIFDNRFGEYRIANYHEIFDLLTGEMYF